MQTMTTGIPRGRDGTSVLACAMAVAVVLLTPPAHCAEAPLRPEPTHIQVAKKFARQFPEEHLLRLPLDDRIAGRAWTNFLDSLDPEHMYFLRKDLEPFNTEVPRLDDRLREGDVDIAFSIYEIYKMRVTNRYQFVSACLDLGFDLATQDTYRWKRRDLPWPADEAEADDLWRRKIQNEYVQIMVTRELAAASATNAPAATNALPSPRDVIINRYRQLATVLEDNDAEWIFQRYLSAFAEAYDPHSAYMSPSSMEDFDIEMKLSLVGIGALLTSEDGAAKVLRIIPGGPADRDRSDNRLRPNDKIIAVADGDKPPVDILHWPLSKVVKLIRGPKGTKVVLTVVPASDPTGSTTKLVPLIRDEVKLEEQAAKSEILTAPDSTGTQRKLGVITLPAFYANMKASPDDSDFVSSAYDVAVILEGMKARGVEGVLLDLRNNGGGSLREAIMMIGLFIRTGIAVQVREARSREPRGIYDTDPDIRYAGPLVVLVNRLSASASEIVAGALQDYGRAVIVGDAKTHGKGSVQTILDLGRDKKMGSIRVTTASYYRISGGSTQLKGIVPDIVIPSPLDAIDLGEENLPNAMEWDAVPPARYRPVADLSPAVKILRRQSADRLAKDEKFAAYLRMIKRLEEIRAAEELPLNLDKRRELARAEQEFSALENEVETREDGGEEPKDKKRPDLVLEETLRILADFIPLYTQATAGYAPASGDEKKTFSEKIGDWIRSVQ